MRPGKRKEEGRRRKDEGGRRKEEEGRRKKEGGGRTRRRGKGRVGHTRQPVLVVLVSHMFIAKKR
jgi:hypothetical protein